MNNNELMLQNRLNGQQQLNIMLQGRITQQINTISQLQQTNMSLQRENNQLRQEIAQLKGKDFFKVNLSKPMQDMADKTGMDIKQAFEDQQFLMAEWMVSQKAFKELAIEFGKEKGFTVDDIIEQGSLKKESVINSENNPDHGSNANGIPLLEELKVPLLKKIRDK